MKMRFGMVAVVAIGLLAGAAWGQRDPNVGAMKMAAWKGDIARVKELVAQGVSLESRDSALGYTPLMWAAMHSDAKTVKALLEMGADAKATTSKGYGTLHAACGGKERLEKFRLLLAAGGDPNAKDELYGNAFEYALNTSAPDEVLQLFIDKGMDVNGKGSGERSALHLAASHSRAEVVAMLLKAGAKASAVSPRGTTPLMVVTGGMDSMDSDAVRTVKLLLAAGVDVKAVDNDGGTALQEAAHVSHGMETRKMLAALIAAGGDVNQADKRGTTPLMTAAGAAVDDRAIVTLLEAKANVNAVDEGGNGVFHYAVQLRDRLTSAHVLSQLKEAHADVNLKNKSGRTPLMEACWAHRADVVTWLIELGANVNEADNDGWTPLLIAASAHDAKILQHWMESQYEQVYGKKLDDAKGMRMYAGMSAMGGLMAQPEICLVLMRHGAKVDAKTKDGTSLQTLLAGRKDKEAEAIRKLVGGFANGGAATTPGGEK